MAQWLGVSWVTGLVTAFITTVQIVIAFEYDRWRNSEGHLTVWERFAVQFGIAFVVTVVLFIMFHGNVSIGSDTYYSPVHTAVCTAELCYQQSARNVAKAKGGKVPPPVANPPVAAVVPKPPLP